MDNVENDESGSTYKIIMSDTMYALFKINNGKMVFIKQYSTSNGEPQLYNETVYSDSSIPLIQEIGLQNYSETMLSLSTTQYTYTVTSSTDTIADITLLRDGNVYKTLRYEKRQYPFEN